MESPELSYRELRGKRTIIVGDVGVGKTQLTKRLLLEAVESTDEPITVLDFAPPVKVLSGVKVGGLLTDEAYPNVRNIKSSLIETPRLSARDGDELVRLAELNKNITESMLKEFMQSPTGVLFVNDASIHLQRGSVRRLWRAFAAAETVIANGYMGERLREDYGTGVSEREKNAMRQLAAKMDKVITLEEV